MKDFVCKKCGNKTYIVQEKSNGTGLATGLYCAQCGTWHKWLNKQEKILHTAVDSDKDNEIARLTAENAELKATLSKMETVEKELRARIENAVELPCIEPMTTWDWDENTGCGGKHFGDYWQILYRDEDGEFIAYIGATKEEAETRLAELKGGRE